VQHHVPRRHARALNCILVAGQPGSAEEDAP
jgi:hypothetical protein